MTLAKFIRPISMSYKFRFRKSFHQVDLCCYSQNRMVSKWSDPKEIQIPVSYGFIAAKAWGNKTGEPVLALHGWQDNAGTFDKLIPLLSTNLYIVAIDAPGHGLSSHKPKGTFYHYMEMLVDIQRVINYLRWETFSILGHSLGGTLGLLYSSVYPEHVQKLILLDVIKAASRETNQLPDVTREGIEGLLTIENKTLLPTPVYSLKEAQSRLVAGMYDQITEESAGVLLKRGSKPSDCGTGVIFSRDIRVKMTEDLHKLSHDDLKAFMKKLRCNILIILGKQSFMFKSRTPEVIDDFLKLYEENCKSFKIVRVEGNHFVHLNNPDRVAPHIDNIFESKLNLSKL